MKTIVEAEKMRINKIIAIKNVGRLKNSTLHTYTTLAKYTFIFGVNGFGKTTIRSIMLRSLKTGDAPSLCDL